MNSTSDIARKIVGDNSRLGRSKSDFYPTPKHVTEMLLTKESFNGNIWECACGKGDISNVLLSAGYKVKSSDINDYKLKRYLPELGWGMGFGKYDTSWDELMPVVDKIHFLRMKDVYRRSNVSVKGDKIFTLYISAQIESVWLAVVNFIEWYNANVATIG